MAERVDRAKYQKLLDSARGLDGWYSRKFGACPGGFAFRDLAAAQTFVEQLGSEPGNQDDQANQDDRPKKKKAAPARDPLIDKFRSFADKLQSEIDHKFGDRVTNTPRQQKQAAHARLDGYHLQRTQQVLRAMADKMEAGELPEALARIRSKKEVHELTASRLEMGQGYYSPSIDTGKPARETPEALAVWGLITPHDQEAEKTRTEREALKSAKIEGYFPTPAGLVDELIELADLRDLGEDARILEPSAGHGAIIEGLERAGFLGKVEAVEINYTLRRVLEAAGRNLVADDFLAYSGGGYDRVIMNPPFEKRRDIAHLRHAFKAVKPGGRVVAIISGGAARENKFQEWLSATGGTCEELPAGSFKESGTGVAACLVVADKPAVTQ